MKAESLNNQTIKVESMAKWKKPYSLIRKHGILDFTRLALRHVLRKTIGLDWRRSIIVERSLAEPIREIVLAKNFRIEQATEDDLYRFKGIVDEYKYNRFRERFKKGMLCFVVLDGERVAAYTWLTFEDEYEPGLKIVVKVHDREAYGVDGYVMPEYRNKGLAAATQSARLMYLRSHGYEKMIGAVDHKNTYSLKVCASSGFRPARAVTLFTIFGLRFHRWQKYAGTR